MRGLLMKDFLVLIRQMKLFLIFIPIMAITIGSSMIPIAILIGATLPITAMAYDEQAKWNDLAAMMPYSKKSRILSKYVLGYLCMAGAAAVFIAVQLIFSANQHKASAENLDMILFAVAGGLLLIAINTPISLKYGTQKGKIVFIAFAGASVTLGSAAIQDWMPSIPEKIISVLPTLTIVSVLVLNVFSILVSLRVRCH